MYLHIRFKDGSNPYVKYGTEKELKKEIKKWEKNFNLTVKESYNTDNKVCGYNAVAMNKEINFKSMDLALDVPLF